MRFFCYSCFFILMFSCQGVGQYDGHWHMVPVPLHLENTEIIITEPLRNETEYVVLDLKDGLGYWDRNMNQKDWWRVVEVQNTNKLWVTGTPCNFGEYHIELNNSILYLNNKIGGPNYIGYKCDGLCCDKQEDYFSDHNVKIDLPILIDSTHSIEPPIKQSLLMVLYFGEPKKNFDIGCNSSSHQLSSGFRLLNFDDIPIAIERFKIKVPENYRDQIMYSIAADKDTNMKKIRELGVALQELGINECFIAVRGDTNLHAHFKPRYIKIKLEDLSIFRDNISIGESISQL